MAKFMTPWYNKLPQNCYFFQRTGKTTARCLLSGNQNNSPPLLKNSLHGLRSLRQAHTDFDSELKTCAASHVLQTVLFNEIKLL